MATEVQQAEISKVLNFASYDNVRRLLILIVARFPSAEIRVQHYGRNVSFFVHGKVVQLAKGTNDAMTNMFMDPENFHKMLGWLEQAIGDPQREAAALNGGLPEKEQRKIDIDKWRCISLSDQGKRCHLEKGHECDHRGYYPDTTWGNNHGC